MTKPFFTPAHRYAPHPRPYRVRVTLGLWLSLGCLMISLLLIAGVIIGLSASYTERHRPVASSASTVESIDFSQPAWAVTVPSLRRVRSLPSEPPQRHPLAPSLYKQSMSVGYTAYQQGDYHTALINFQRALTEKKGDRYAAEAIANTEAIIQKQREERLSQQTEKK